MTINEICALSFCCFIPLLGFLFSKSRVIFYIETFILILITGFYDGYMDIGFYKSEYSMGYFSQSPLEKGYELLSFLFHIIGVPFVIFHLLVTAICIIGFATVIIRISPKPAFCMALMYGFATFEYAWQIKALCASAITVLALYYLYKSTGTLKSYIIYSLLIVLAAEFHFSAVLYLFVVICYRKSERRLIKQTVFLVLILTIVTPFIIRIGAHIVPAMVDYQTKLSIKTFVLLSVWQAFGVFILYYIQRGCLNDGIFSYAIRKYPFAREKDDEFSSLDTEDRIISFIFQISCAMLLIIPFYRFSGILTRIVRGIFPYYFIVISFLSNRIRRLNLYSGLLILYSLGSFWIFYLYGREDGWLLREFFCGNLFLKWVFCL